MRRFFAATARWIGVVPFVAMVLACHAPPAEHSIDWETALGLSEDSEVDAIEDDAERPRGRLRTGSTPPRAQAPSATQRLARLDPALVTLPELLGNAGAQTAARLVAESLAAGEVPDPALLRPDWHVVAFEPPVEAPVRNAATLHAEAVVSPWDKRTVLLFVGLRAAENTRAPLRQVDASVVWSWLDIDGLRHVGEPLEQWRRQDATPWATRIPRLEAGQARVSLFEIRPFDWTELGGPPTYLLDEPDPSESLMTFKVRYADRYGVPGQLSGRVHLSPRRVTKATPAARVAVASAAWARKLRGDPELRRVSWRAIRRMVPTEGIDEPARSKLLRSIDHARSL